MIDMAGKDILPAISEYADMLSGTVSAKRAVAQGLACRYETSVVTRLSELADAVFEKKGELEAAVAGLADAKDIIEESAMIRDTLLPKMDELRSAADEAETMVSSEYWPYPSYGDLLFSVR